MVREALDKGLRIDVGHGSHFSYRMARIALDAGIIPDTLGADMHGYNTAVPAPATVSVSLAHCASCFGSTAATGSAGAPTGAM